MTFQFTSLAEFLNMGGHGVYVWFCYIVTAASFSYLALAPWLRKRQFFRIQKAIFSRHHS